jgi:hypothetical protein
MRAAVVARAMVAKTPSEIRKSRKAILSMIRRCFIVSPPLLRVSPITNAVPEVNKVCLCAMFIDTSAKKCGVLRPKRALFRPERGVRRPRTDAKTGRNGTAVTHFGTANENRPSINETTLSRVPGLRDAHRQHIMLAGPAATKWEIPHRLPTFKVGPGSHRRARGGSK